MPDEILELLSDDNYVIESTGNVPTTHNLEIVVDVDRIVYVFTPKEQEINQ